MSRVESSRVGRVESSRVESSRSSRVASSRVASSRVAGRFASRTVLKKTAEKVFQVHWLQLHVLFHQLVSGGSSSCTVDRGLHGTGSGGDRERQRDRSQARCNRGGGDQKRGDLQPGIRRCLPHNQDACVSTGTGTKRAQAEARHHASSAQGSSHKAATQIRHASRGKASISA